VRAIGSRAVRLYPLYHPAAALYTPSMLETLRADFQRIPGLLAEGAPPQPEAPDELPDLDELYDPDEDARLGVASVGAANSPVGAPSGSVGALTSPEPASQLGLF